MAWRLDARALGPPSAALLLPMARKSADVKFVFCSLAYIVAISLCPRKHEQRYSIIRVARIGSVNF